MCDITYNHLNKINTKTNDLNIKIRNKNLFYFLILNFELILLGWSPLHKKIGIIKKNYKIFYWSL